MQISEMHDPHESRSFPTTIANLNVIKFYHPSTASATHKKAAEQEL
jgi:hypothetical protein